MSPEKQPFCPRIPSKEDLKKFSREQLMAVQSLIDEYNNLVKTLREIDEAIAYSRTPQYSLRDFSERTASMIVADTAEFRINQAKKKIAEALQRAEELSLKEVNFVQDMHEALSKI